jgi:hypothetical protein
LTLSASRPLEVVMAHLLPRYALGLCLALSLAACGSSPNVDESAADAGVSSAQDTGSDRTPAAGGSGADGSGGGVDGSGGGGLPGGPGADPAGGGDDGGVAQGNPGAPGDVAVFEEGGDAPYSALVDDAATKCADGACSLQSPIILDGDPDRVEGGVGACTIAEKTDILYDPPAQGGRFQTGATVTAQVHCADVETPVGNTDDGTPSGNDPAGVDPAHPDGSTSDGTTPDDSTSDGTPPDGTAPDTGEQPQG